MHLLCLLLSSSLLSPGTLSGERRTTLGRLLLMMLCFVVSPLHNLGVIGIVYNTSALY